MPGLLVVHCLPRLIGGSSLTDFERPLIDPESPLGDLLASLSGGRSRVDASPSEGMGWRSLIVIGFMVAIVRLARRLRQAAGSGPAGGRSRHDPLGLPDRGRLSW